MLGSGDPREFHYYFNGVQLGDVSNNGTSEVDYVTAIARRSAASSSSPFEGGASVSHADFDQSYDPVNGLDYGSAATRYTVIGPGGWTLFLREQRAAATSMQNPRP